MALSPKRRIFYMKYNSYLPINYNHPFKMITFIVMRCFYYQYEINTQRTNLSCGYFWWLPEWLLLSHGHY